MEYDDWQKKITVQTWVYDETFSEMEHSKAVTLREKKEHVAND